MVTVNNPHQVTMSTTLIPFTSTIFTTIPGSLTLESAAEITSGTFPSTTALNAGAANT